MQYPKIAVRPLVLYAISGIISGIAFVGFFAEGSPTSRNFAMEWFPGLVFGGFLGMSLKWPSHTTLSFASISAVYYYCVISMFFLCIPTSSGVNELVGLALAGAVAGAAGAAMLSITGRIFCGVKQMMRADLFTVLIGAGVGAAFIVFAVNVHSDGATSIWSASGRSYWQVHMSVAFMLWQVLVGMRIYDNLHLDATSPSAGQFSDSVSSFLLGPVVQLVGLVGTIMAAVSALRN